MRVATFNLLHGRSLHDGRVEPERLHEAVCGLDADVLGMQEVDRDQPRSGRLDIAAIAADALGAVDHRFAPTVVGTPGEGFTPATGRDASAPDPCLDGQPRYGVALASRWPVSRWLLLRLPAAPARSPVLVDGRVVLLVDEPRVLLAAVIDAPFGRYTVATTHLSFAPGWNVRQLRRVVRALAQLPAPRILLGDLNVPASVARVVSGWRVAARHPTYPAPDPRIQLDHVLIDPSSPVTVTASASPATAISDHRPLIVRLRCGTNT